MIDYFAVLDQPRRPCLDAETLKARFHVLSTELHPDRVTLEQNSDRQAVTNGFTELNAAYACLRDPRDRIRHLVELETGRKPADLQEIPGSLATLLLEAATLCRGADEFIGEYTKLTSPLLRAGAFPACQEWVDRLMAFQARLQKEQDGLLAELKQCDDVWAGASARDQLLSELARISRGLGFFSRWQQQMQERMNSLLL